MKKKMIMLMMAAVLTATGAAQAASVKYDYDRTADASAWSGWAWKWTEAPKASLAESRIRRSLAAGFTARGYAEVERRSADFLVEFHAGAGREIRLNEGWGYRGRRDLRVDTYAKGVLVVDVTDRRTGRLAWRGSVSDGLADDPAEADKKMQKAVTKLLQKFPAREAP